MEYKYKEKGFIAEYRDDSFLDSLRDDYSEFNSWYDKQIDCETKSSHYWLEGGKLKAFLGIKEEEEAIQLDNNTLPANKRLKITTIKSKGIKGFSEFFIYQAMKRARQLSIKEVYFTVIPNNNEKQQLFEIAISYGFKIIGQRSTSQDGVTRKQPEMYLMKTLGETNGTWKETYPNLGLHTKPKFGFVVFNQKFHDVYIQDAELFGTDQKRDFSKMGIQKAYVHNQKYLSSLPINSIILIYRKGVENNKTKTSVVTGVGKIVSQFIKGIHYKDFDSFKKIVKTNHAFADEDTLRVWFNKGNYLTLFGLYHSFGIKHNVNLEFIKSIGLNHSGPIYNWNVEWEQFKKIWDKGVGKNV